MYEVVLHFYTILQSSGQRSIVRASHFVQWHWLAMGTVGAGGLMSNSLCYQQVAESGFSNLTNAIAFTSGSRE